MEIRKASYQDIDKIHELLCYVLNLHHNIRKDLFKEGASKYSKDEIKTIIDDDKYTIFVCLLENEVVGYIFTFIKETKGDNIIKDHKSLYIDDLCVNPQFQHMHIGSKLLKEATKYAKENNCYNITLNVWEGNNYAKEFYERQGFKPYKYCLERTINEEE